MFIGRQVTAVCRRCPPATRSPTTTSDQPASSSLVYFLRCLPAFLCIFVSPLDPLRDHRLWWTTPLAEKCALARSKSDFSARLPEQSDAVWTCKKSSHSIFVLIYNDIYHFLWSNKMVSKRDTHFTIDTTYCLRVSFTLSREEKDQLFLPPFPFHQNAQVSSNLGCCSVRKQFFLSERQNTRRRPSSFFFGLQLKWLRGTMQVYNLFKCLTRQKDDGGRLLMAK